MGVPTHRSCVTLDPPSVPADRLAGWVETDRSVETAFDAKLVSVRAHTVVYDDRDLRERVREATDIDHQWRFFLAARLRLEPRTEPSGPLTRLVADRARSGFRDRLADRGFQQLRRTETTRRERDGTTTREATYEAVLPLDATQWTRRATDPLGGDGPPGADDTTPTGDGPSDERVTLRTRAQLAVWPGDAEYLLAGGGYPTGVRTGADPLRASLGDHLDPEAFASDLDALIESVV